MNWPVIERQPVLTKKEKASIARKNKAAEKKAEIEKIKAIAAARNGKNKITPLNEYLSEFVNDNWFHDWYLDFYEKDPLPMIEMWMTRPDEEIYPFKSRDAWVMQILNNMFNQYKRHIKQYKNYWYWNIAKCESPKKRRSIIMRMATPEWADMFEIAKIHKQREWISFNTGIKHEVDHIIPIQHPLVCGLNNQFNLRIITKSENSSKSNNFTPYWEAL